jgi:hypothetical protein
MHRSTKHQALYLRTAAASRHGSANTTRLVGELATHSTLDWSWLLNVECVPSSKLTCWQADREGAKSGIPRDAADSTAECDTSHVRTLADD